MYLRLRLCMVCVVNVYCEKLQIVVDCAGRCGGVKLISETCEIETGIW